MNVSAIVAGNVQWQRFTPFIESLLIIVATYLLLLIAKFFLSKLQKRETVPSNVVEQVYRLLSLVLYSVMIVAILYTLTSAREVFYVLLVVLAAILFANWKLIADITAYYVMLLSRHGYRRGSPVVEIPRLGVRGKIVEVTPLYTRVRGLDGSIFYVPNSVMIEEVVHQLVGIQTTVAFKLRLRLDPEKKMADQVETLRRLIRKGVEESHSTVRQQDMVIRIDKLSSDEMEVLLAVPIAGSEPRPSTINNIVTHLYEVLREYSPTITLVPLIPK